MWPDPHPYEPEPAALARWCLRREETAPADRLRAEAAVRAFYRAVGWLGEPDGYVWVDSFRQFARLLRRYRDPVPWVLVDRLGPLRMNIKPDAPACRALVAALRDAGDMQETPSPEDGPEGDEEEEQEGYGWEDEPEPEEEEEEQNEEDLILPPLARNLAPFFNQRCQLVPSMYATETLVRWESQRLRGELQPWWSSSALLDVLGHCAAFFPFRRVALLCDHPEEAEDIPLGVGNPAGVITRVGFRSGREEYSLNGWGLTQQQLALFMNFDHVSGNRILDELDGETRRWACAARGIAALAAGMDVEKVMWIDDHQLRRQLLEAMPPGHVLPFCESECFRDSTGVLHRIAVPEDEDLCYVEVLDATESPDGTRKTHLIRVPPTVSSAREAVAWSFRLHDPDEYAPLVET